jgi:hypothetical protein
MLLPFWLSAPAEFPPKASPSEPKNRIRIRLLDVARGIIGVVDEKSCNLVEFEKSIVL